MPFDPDAFLAEKKKTIRAKSPEVEAEYESINPAVKSIVAAAPGALTITSGRRSPEQNSAVGGVPGSRHTYGDAVDVRETLDPETQKYFEDKGLKVIPESDHTHIQANEGFVPKDSFDPDAFLNDSPSPKSIQSSWKDNSLLGLGSGMTRQIPGTNLLGGAVNSQIAQPVADFANYLQTGEAKRTPAMESFKEGYSNTKNQVEDISKRNPVSSTFGSMIAAIPEYTYGMGALGTGGKLAARLFKGAATGLGVGQGARGFELDPAGNAIDASLGAAGELGGAAVDKFVEAIPGARARLFNRALGTTPKDIEAGKNVGKDLVDMGGMMGTEESLYKKASEGLRTSEDKLQKILQNTDTPIDRSIVQKDLEDLFTKFDRRPLSKNDSDVTFDLIDEFVNKYSDVNNASQANQLKREIYEMLGDRPFIAETVPGKKDALKTMARGLKKSVEAVAPETKGINQELKTFGRVRDLLDKKIARTESGIGSSTGEMIKKGMTGGAGYAAAGPAGAAFTLGGRAAADSVLANTASAQGLKYLQKLLEEAAKQGISPRAIGPVGSSIIGGSRR